jgi:hypothetical protein
VQPPHTSFHFLRCFWRLKRCCLLTAFTRNLLLHSTCVARNFSSARIIHFCFCGKFSYRF